MDIRIKLIIGIILVGGTISLNAQTWSGQTPGNIYYNSGNVGIGSTTPQSKFHIVNGGQSIKFLTGTNSSDYELNVGVNDDGINFNSSSVIRSINFWNAAQRINLLTGSNSSGYALNIGVNDNGVNFSNNSSSRGFNFSNYADNLLTIKSNGYIGIGSTSPDYKLTVIGDARIQNSNSTQSAEAWFSYLNGSQANGLFLNTTSQTGLSYSVVGFAETNTGTAAGIYGRGTSTGTGAVTYAGYFNGNLAYTGTLTQVSDEKFKDQITDAGNSLNKILTLKPKEYYFKSIAGYDFPTGKKVGFIAQELIDVFPDLVSTGSHLIIDKNDRDKAITDEYLSVDYISLIPHLVKAIQEQNFIIEAYKKDLSAIQDIILNQSNTIAENILIDIPNITQIFPNPSSSTISIAINNPTNSQASIIIKDKNGLTRIEKREVNNTVEISIAELENGVFFVILIIDGVNYDLKRFIVSK